MNRIFSLLVFALIPAMLWSQKKKLTHDDYDMWKSIKNYSMDALGKSIVYEIKPQQGDGLLYLYSTVTGESKSFERGISPKLSYDGNYLVFVVKPLYAETREAKRKEKTKDELPKYHVVVLDVNTGKTDTVKNASSFKMPEEDEGFLAIKLDDEVQKKKTKKKEKENGSSVEETKEKDVDKKPAKKTAKNRVIVRSLNGEISDTLNWVAQHNFAVKNSNLILN